MAGRAKVPTCAMPFLFFFFMDGRPPFATGFESLSVSNRIGSVSAKTHRCIYSGPENACVTRRCPPRGPEWRGPAPPSSTASTSITTTSTTRLV